MGYFLHFAPKTLDSLGPFSLNGCSFQRPLLLSLHLPDSIRLECPRFSLLTTSPFLIHLLVLMTSYSLVALNTIYSLKPPIFLSSAWTFLLNSRPKYSSGYSDSTWMSSRHPNLNSQSSLCPQNHSPHSFPHLSKWQLDPARCS